jgi:hypothetical protein
LCKISVVLSPGPLVTENAASLTGPGPGGSGLPDRAGPGPPRVSVMAAAAAAAVPAAVAVSPDSRRRRRTRPLAKTVSTGLSMCSPEKDSRTWHMTSSCSFTG